MLAEQQFAPVHKHTSEVSYREAFQTLVMLFRNQFLDRVYAEQCSELCVSHFDQLLTLARKMSMPAAIVALPLDRIELKQLPAILLLDNHKTLILTNIRESGCVVIDPETGNAHLESAASLSRQYAGMLFTAKPVLTS